jgi:chromate reductase, NAD(P)H dehydrogenase (quinone)
MRVLGLSGSLRADSHNTRLLRAAAEVLPPGAELELWSGMRDIPAFSEDDEHDAPAAVRDLHDRVREADAVLIATPEYNSSIPGVLKNALDWVSRPYDATPLRGKPVAVVGASTGLFGAVWAQAEARKVARAIGAHVLDDEMPVGTAHEAFDEHGRLRDAEVQARLGVLLENLLAHAGAPLEAQAA